MEQTRPEYRPAPAALAGSHLCLYMVLCGEHPTAGGMAFDLAGIKQITIGRGGPMGASARGPGVAHIEVPDPTISGDHARITISTDAPTLIEDLGSRNGTRLRGKAVTRALLSEGDWFLVGRTVFLLRRVAAPTAAQPIRAGGSSRLATFVPQLATIFQTAVDLAPSRVPILLLGETGTGKDVVAREIHALSGRAGKYVAVNCAALPDTLVESELFGYRKGAFSDAREDRAGLIRSAAGGTLLLDEIGDLPPPSQAKLLRVLQDGEVLPLGSATPIQVDLRILAATQQNLDAMVREGRFRADLLGRLAGFTINLSPLRDRAEDLGLLTAAVFDRHAGADASTFKINADAAVALVERRWPLNIREFERVLQAAMELAKPSREIGVEHLGPPPKLSSPGDMPASELEAELHRLLRLRAGNVSAVAREMGKARMQIHRWMNQFGLKPDDFRPAGAPPIGADSDPDSSDP